MLDYQTRFCPLQTREPSRTSTEARASSPAFSLSHPPRPSHQGDGTSPFIHPGVLLLGPFPASAESPRFPASTRSPSMTTASRSGHRWKGVPKDAGR